MTFCDWKENWLTVGSVESGAQGDSKIVTRHVGDSEKYFLKVLKRQSDPERRARMYREVSAYETLSHSGIPRLVETNASQFRDPKYHLYLVTEFIEGVNLANLITQRGPMSIMDALSLTIQLLEIIDYCHQNECVHRDIKPDNIMLRSGNLDSPVLVDFGLSFNRTEETDFLTNEGQEIGNRFLRLPEYSVDSQNKRDPRSDVTLACGILLYTMTGCQPGILVDEHSRYPHQRPNVLAKFDLPSISNGHMLQIFDRAFQPNIAYRWNNATELKLELEGLTRIEHTEFKSSEQMMTEIRQAADSASFRQARARHDALAQSLKEVGQIFDRVVAPTEDVIVPFHGGYNIDAAIGVGRQVHGVRRLDNGAQVRILFEAKVVGANVLVTAQIDDEVTELLRTLWQEPKYDGVFTETLTSFILRKVSVLIL